MAAETNFLQFDVNGTNMLSDEAYLARGEIDDGVSLGIAPSILHNKMYYQWSTFIAAFADMLVAKGYSPLDTSKATLITVLANILTNADVAGILVPPPLRFTLQGVPIVGTKVVQAVTTKTQTFTSIICYSDVQPTSANLIFLVKKNGTLAATCTLTASTNSTLGVVWASGSSFAVVSGDRVSIDITQIGSGVAGGNDLLIGIS